MKKLIALAAVIAAPLAMANGVQTTSANLTAEATVAQTCTVEATSGTYNVNYGGVVAITAKTNSENLVSASISRDAAGENLAGDEMLIVDGNAVDLVGSVVDVPGVVGELDFEVSIESDSVQNGTAKADDYVAKAVINIDCSVTPAP